MRGLPFAILAVGLHSVLFPHFSKAELEDWRPGAGFRAQDQWGNTVRLTDFKGKKTRSPCLLHQSRHAGLNEGTRGISG